MADRHGPWAEEARPVRVCWLEPEGGRVGGPALDSLFHWVFARTGPGRRLPKEFATLLVDLLDAGPDDRARAVVGFHLGALHDRAPGQPPTTTPGWSPSATRCGRSWPTHHPAPAPDESPLAVVNRLDRARLAREHNHPGLSDNVAFVNQAVSDHFPNDHALESQAEALLLNAERRYRRAPAVAVQRIVDRGRSREAALGRPWRATTVLRRRHGGAQPG
ncbi:hypothetical protein [Kitasatospora sp. NPDC002965]|uniref:hypothetical protein n=1 Tax=Kitasatospora sp. NPDC002965 TaxID=3154775 RepID=UPI0033BD7032